MDKYLGLTFTAVCALVVIVRLFLMRNNPKKSAEISSNAKKENRKMFKFWISVVLATFAFLLVVVFLDYVGVT